MNIKENMSTNKTRDVYTHTLTVDEWAEKTHMASDYSRVKKLSVSAYCWTKALNLLGNRRSQLCDQEMQRINLPLCVYSKLACAGKH